MSGVAAEQSTADLIRNATEQMSRLVRDELRLAQAELAEKGRNAGMGIGLLSGGGVVALYGVGALIATVILALDLAMPAWLAALIVTVVLFVVAGILALVGRGRVKRAVPPMPKEAIAGVRADVDAVTTAVKDRGETR